MKGILLLAIAMVLVSLLFSPLLFRKRNVPLVNNGRVVAIAKRPLSGEKVSVYANGTKLFCLYKDFTDFPIYVYPFADGKKFLCIFDDDTSVPVFIVDMREAATNDAASDWPPDGYTKQVLQERAPKCAFDTRGKVRLPSCSEVEEVSSFITKIPQSQVEKASFPSADFGLYRFYWPKQALLNDLDTNRHSVWP